MKYIVETWLTEEVIKVFSTQEDLDAWMDENAEWFSDGAFVEGIGRVITRAE